MSIVYDPKAKEWKDREARRKREPKADQGPVLRDGVGVIVASLPHVNSASDWAPFLRSVRR